LGNKLFSKIICPTYPEEHKLKAGEFPFLFKRNSSRRERKQKGGKRMGGTKTEQGRIIHFPESVYAYQVT
jgi:hypothetical protein